MPKPVATRRRNRELIAWSLVGILSAWGFFAGWKISHESANTPEVVRFDVAPQGGAAIGSLAVSPDGRRIVMSVRPRSDMANERVAQLWLYSTVSGRAEPIPKSERATQPFWSPDGKAIGYFADGWLKKLDLSSGIVVPLCESKMNHGASWGSKGTIIFAPSPRGPLYRLNASGGPATAFTELKEFELHGLRSPWFLPDGERFVFWASDQAHRSGIFVSSLKSPHRADFLVSATGSGIYASGHLLYVNKRTLMAVPFDPDLQKLTGAPVALAENVQSRPMFRGESLFSASALGALAYYESTGTRPSEMTWFGLDGQKLGNLGSQAAYQTAACLQTANRWL